MVDVTLEPSRPANGDVFTVIVILIVGGSMGVETKGIEIDGSLIVSETDAIFNPATQIISPA